MDAPVIAIVDVAHGGGDAAFGHHGVSFAEQRFGDDADLYAGSGSFNGRAQSGSTRADDQDIMFESLILGHLYRILQSVQMPMEHILIYRSEKPTEKRLHQAQSMWPRLRQLTQS